MTDRDVAELRRQMEGVAETIREYVRQIESGEYPGEWTIWRESDDTEIVTVTATSDDEAIEGWRDLSGSTTEVYATLNHSYDEPTVNETSIYEYPLEIVDERGKPFEVLICTGGPGIGVEANGLDNATLEGYWWGDRYTMHGDEFSAFLDYFIDRYDDER